MADLRNAEARARDKWLTSDEGKAATAGSASGVYLYNRIENGFCSGWDAAMHQQDIEGIARLRDSLKSPVGLASYTHLGRAGAGALAEDIVKCLDKIIADAPTLPAQKEEEKLTLDNALVQVSKSQKYVSQLIKEEHIPANLLAVYGGLSGALALAMKYLLDLQNKVGVPQR